MPWCQVLCLLSHPEPKVMLMLLVETVNLNNMHWCHGTCLMSHPDHEVCDVSCCLCCQLVLVCFVCVSFFAVSPFICVFLLALVCFVYISVSVCSDVFLKFCLNLRAYKHACLCMQVCACVRVKLASMRSMFF